MSGLVANEDALQKAAEKLDISPTKYQQAMNRFGSIKSYLLEGEYKGMESEPDIFLQGSFKLGTEIRPYINSKESDYDIDLVCCLGHQKHTIAAQELKGQVGDHLKANGTYNKLLDTEGRRCWTLNYAEEDGIGFHMDVLPAVKETCQGMKEDAIAATNKAQNDTYSWITSNPRGFANWFYQINAPAFNEVKYFQKRAVFNRRQDLFDSVDDVPSIHVKTPLQRSIQLLKRHRDVRFSQSEIEEFKPISMIITLVAAQCYQNEKTIFEFLKNLITTLDQQSQQLRNDFLFNKRAAHSVYSLITRTDDGKWSIPNPTNPGENFADRWHENAHARAKAFFQWVSWLQDDFINIDNFVEEDRFIKSLVEVSPPKKVGSKVNFNVHHKEPLNYPLLINKGYLAEIKASQKTNIRWERFDSGQTLLKGKSLKFVLKTDVPEPFHVYWQIVNTGQEAKIAGQLRGEISKHNTVNTTSIYRTESTSYIGDHWVEAFIVKNNVCVAKTGEFIVSIRDGYT